MFVDASGNVGVGVNAPTGTIDLVSESTNGYGLRMRGRASDNYSAIQFVSNDNTSQVGYIGAASNTLIFGTGASERARIDSSGTFHVKGAGTAGVNDAVQLNGSAPANSLLLDASGRLGLGTSNPSARFHALGLVSAPSLTFNNSAVSTFAAGSVQAALGVSDSAPFPVYLQARDSVNGSRNLLLNPLGGRVGIGTTSPGYSLDVAPPAAGGAIRMRGGSGGASAFQFTDATASSQWGVITATSASLNTAHSSILTFSTASSERARIDSSGRLLVGTPSARDTIDVENTNVTPSFQIEGGTSSTAHALITRYTANNFAGYFSLAKTRSSTVGNHAVVADDDSLGRLRWLGDDGTDFEVAAQIEAFVDGTPGANDMPGRLVFSTTADGASSPTERMRISSDGRVGINGAANDYQNFGVNGTTTQTDGSATEVISARPTFNTVATSLRIFNSRPFTASGTALTHYSHFFADPNTVNGTVASQYGFAVSSNLTAGTNNYGFYGAISSGTGRWNFYASGTANNYFSGTTLINTTDASTTSNTAGVVFERQGALIARRSATCLFLNRFTSDGNIAAFYRSGTNVGTISVTTTATAYNTSSDYRLKENVVDLTGAIDRVNQLQVRRFNFIADPDTTVDGFIAHEAQAVVPESVTGTKDAVEDIGTLTEWDGTVIETDVTEPESLTWEETITDEDGNETVETHTRTWVKTGDRPVYQGIDQSKLVPLLTAALQEALAEIESLKARVTALEP